MAYVFDIETDGLYDQVTKLHCLVIKDTETGVVMRHNNQRSAPNLFGYVEEGLRFLMEQAKAGHKIVGHNIIKYDLPVIKKLYPWFDVPEESCIDTIVLTRLIYADLKDIDTKLVRKGQLPGHMFGAHSLDSWGHRLKLHKGDYAKRFRDDFIALHGEKAWKPGMEWARWSIEMEDYNEQDVVVTDALYTKLMGKQYSERSIDLEHAVAFIIARQERHGFLFDEAAAGKLYATLVAHKLRIEGELKKVFHPRFLRDGKDMVPKRDNRTMGYIANAPLTKLKLTEFNPGSRDHIALWLKRMFDWQPEDFTPDGKPKIDETVLSQMPYAEARLLSEYLMVDKRLGQVAEGKQAWLKKVNSETGRIHCSVNSNGAVTGRMTHSNPNLAQVPAGYSPYGPECRALFTVPAGKVLVGADGAALELRDLAGYMAKFDGGSYMRTVLGGSKDEGTDIHSVNARALGLDPKAMYFVDPSTGKGKSGRDLAKTWFYAFIYGAGDEKLGNIITMLKGDEAKKAGAKSRANFMRNLPALAELIKRVKKKVKDVGYLTGQDGRLLHIRSQHAALNTLLQSAGAVQMKMGLVILDRKLKAAGLVPGINYEFVANVHDEWQIEVDEDKGEFVGKTAVEALREAGEFFKFACPLDGAYEVGRNWAETH